MHDVETTGTQYLRGRCITAMDIDPDGRVWVQGGTVALRDTVHTYVITSEAVAAIEVAEATRLPKPV